MASSFRNTSFGVTVDKLNSHLLKDNFKEKYWNKLPMLHDSDPPHNSVIIKKHYFKNILIILFLLLISLLFQRRPALTLGAAARSRPTTSVHTRLQPPCSWEPFLVAPCLACPRRAPTLSISVSLLMRFLMTCLCPRGGRWPRPPLARDTSSSEYAGNKCQHLGKFAPVSENENSFKIDR